MRFTARVTKLSEIYKCISIGDDEKRFDKFYNKTANKEIFITLETEKNNRSVSQNSYYWGVIIYTLSDHTGFSTEEMHEILKHKFLRHTVWVEHNTGIKEMSVITKSTTDLTTVDFEKYLSDIRGWASLCLGCYLPLPNEPVGV